MNVQMEHVSHRSRGEGQSGVILDLLDSLDREQVAYCHWKSNVRLAETLTGDEDVDILVRRSDAARFRVILAECGFKLAQSRFGTDHPGVIHAFALDPETLQLLHVHAYFQVVTGDSLVKSYRLPVEEALLGSTERQNGVRVPPKHVELAMFLVRVALKHTSPFELMMVGRNYRATVDELAWLRAAADEEAARRFFFELAPTAEPGLFDDLVAATSDPAAKWRRVALGVRLARHLASRRRIGWIAGMTSHFYRVGVLVACRMLRRRPLVPVSGGAIVAFVGPKATGKSTLTKALSRRLGKNLDTCILHVGKPPPTVLTWPVRLLLPALRRLMPRQKSSSYEDPGQRQLKAYPLVYVARSAILAHERRRLLMRALRLSAGGTIVICDRYPSPVVGAIDSPRFGDEQIASEPRGLKRRLMEIERRAYVGLPDPALVLRLVAPMEVAIDRDAKRNKSDGPDPEALRRRRDLESSNIFDRCETHEVRTDRALEDTVREITAAAWSLV